MTSQKTFVLLCAQSHEICAVASIDTKSSRCANPSSWPWIWTL